MSRVYDSGVAAESTGHSYVEALSHARSALSFQQNTANGWTVYFPGISSLSSFNLVGPWQYGVGFPAGSPGANFFLAGYLVPSQVAANPRSSGGILQTVGPFPQFTNGSGVQQAGEISGSTFVCKANVQPATGAFTGSVPCVLDCTEVFGSNLKYNFSGGGIFTAGPGSFGFLDTNFTLTLTSPSVYFGPGVWTCNAASDGSNNVADGNALIFLSDGSGVVNITNYTNAGGFSALAGAKRGSFTFTVPSPGGFFRMNVSNLIAGGVWLGFTL